MGYTRYWHRTDKPITQEFVDEVKKIIASANKKGILCRGGDGKDEPIISLDCVCFNGDGDYGLDHETCWFDNVDKGFNFCKTARKPYDHVVKRVLTVAKKEGLVSKVSSDGQNNMITDVEYLDKYCKPF